jgi:monoamine oxidase
VGGRVWTVHDPHVGVSIELGAEFVHGAAPPVVQIAREAGLEVVRADGEFLTGVRGTLRPADHLWAQMSRVFSHLDPARKEDRSFAQALAAIPMVRPADRRMALQYIEGFEAADPARISERALARSLNRSTGGDDGHSARVLGGYDGIVNALATCVRRRIKLGRIVSGVNWSPGAVEIVSRSAASGRAFPNIRARAAVITVPLGVLTAPADAEARIAIHPAVPSRERAMHALAMGAAMRVALVLDEPFWLSRRFSARHGHRRFDDLSFLLAGADVPFPTWWTAYPAPAPLLVGWRGGPRAWTMSEQPRDAVVHDAVRSAAELFAMPVRTMARHVRSAHTHDWIHDPFTLGAYSYACVGGAAAAAALARPVKHTLYFAGEHVYGHGREGTVDGAIASGQRAAHLLLRQFR